MGGSTLVLEPSLGMPQRCLYRRMNLAGPWAVSELFAAVIALVVSRPAFPMPACSNSHNHVMFFSAQVLLFSEPELLDRLRNATLVQVPTKYLNN